MNDIIKKIEDAQLKESVADFNVGDTVRVSAKIKEVTVREYRYSRVQYLRDRAEAQERLSQSESFQMA